MASGIEKALLMLRNLPRVAIHNIRDLPEYQRIREKMHELPRGRHARFKIGGNHKGGCERMSRGRLGFGKSTPGYLKIPKEYYYEGHHTARQYVPLSLLQLQRLIDLGRLDISQPIDLTQISNTKVVNIEPHRKQYGIQITDEGADIFKAQINLEVQWIMSELTIAAIERNGGVVTTKFYDIDCVRAMVDPPAFFKSGKPIPRNGTPPLNAIEYYTSAENRGYLADPELIKIERLKLAQKYGYELKDVKDEKLKNTLNMRKDPRQIWFGLEPGWIVNLKDKVVLKPGDKEWIEYYKS